jgi:hypothetical protein
MITHLKSRSKHSLFFTKRIRLFDNLYANPDIKDLKLAANRLNPLMYFDKEYKLDNDEKNLFKSLISLAEDDFMNFYIPSQEPLLSQMSLERSNEEMGLLYIYSRRYNVMHQLSDPGTVKANLENNKRNPENFKFICPLDFPLLP